MIMQQWRNQVFFRRYSEYRVKHSCIIAVWSLYYWLCPLHKEQYTLSEDLTQPSRRNIYIADSAGDVQDSCHWYPEFHAAS